MMNNTQETETNEDELLVVFDAVQYEYKQMASWYDSFWSSYTNGTLRIPLNEVINYMQNIVNTRDGSSEGNKQLLTVIDVGCGTGSFLRGLLDTFTTNYGSLCNSITLNLIGVEPSPEMLEQARKKFQYYESNSSTSTSIVLKQSPAEQLPIDDDDTANVIVSTNAFHFFRNKDTALQEMKRVLKQNGSLVITDWCNDYWIVKLYHLLERIRWNWRFKESYPAPLSSCHLINLVKTAGFCDVQHTKYTVRIFSVIFWGMQTITAKKKNDSLWVCDNCQRASFADYDDALAHEKECTGVNS